MVSFYFVISRQERRSNMTTKNNPAVKSVEHGYAGYFQDPDGHRKGARSA